MRNTAAIARRSAYAITLLLGLGLAPSSALAGLEKFFAATGRLSLSVDGAGENSPSHIAQVEKPNASAKVRKAYVMAASWCGANTIPNNSVTMNGTPITWDEFVTNAFFLSVRADVTSLVKAGIDSAPAGRIDFTFVESVNNGCIDGEALVVVFDDPLQDRDTTIILLFGGQALTGDTFKITLAEPIDPASEGALADMGLGISFGYQPSGQYSLVEVNGQRLSTSAGGQDDGGDENGGLITVGGLNDSNENPPDPFATDQTCGPPEAPRCDDELYSLLPFITTDVTSISVFTQNPSNDDNIFFAYFHISGAAILGQGIVLGPSSASNLVGTQHTVKATVIDDRGAPVAGKLVTFNVTLGPNAGKRGTATTNSQGEAAFTYTGARVAGTDRIQASFVDSQRIKQTSNTVTKDWTLPGCVDVEGPCLAILASADEDYSVTLPPNSDPQVSPGRKVHVQTSELKTLQVTKTGQVIPLGPCRQSLSSSSKVTFTQMVDAVTGEVLSTSEVSALRAGFSKLRQLSKLQRQAILAAANGAGEFDLKVFSLNPATLTIAEQHGCQGVQLKATIKIVGLNDLGNAVVTVQGDGSREWRFQ